jgi:hypothetical protein
VVVKEKTTKLRIQMLNLAIHVATQKEIIMVLFSPFLVPRLANY